MKQVVLGWMGESRPPENIVFCIPSQAIEAWVATALFPEDEIVQSGKLECYASPEKLIDAKQKKESKIKKQRKDYERKVIPKLADRWKNPEAICSEAKRFSNEFSIRISVLVR